MQRSSVVALTVGAIVISACSKRTIDEPGANANAPPPAKPVAARVKPRTTTHASVVREPIRARLEGAAARVDGAGWSWSLGLARWGRAGAMNRVAATSPVREAARTVYARGDVREWYAPIGDGVEQGFTLARRPAGAGPLLLELAGDGLRARVDGGDIALSDAGGLDRARYGELHATDARGRALPASLDVVDGHVTIRVDDSGADYPIAIDPSIYAVATTFPVSGSGRNVVAMSGDTIVVGLTSSTSGAGSATVYGYSGGAWTKQASLTTTSPTQSFGSCVGIDGTTAIVGDESASAGGVFNAGVVHVFVQSGTSWSEQATLAPPSPFSSEQFGSDCVVSGNAFVASTNGSQSSPIILGGPQLFTRSGSSWTGASSMLEGAAGMSVAIAGGLAASGEPEGSNGTVAYSGVVFSAHQTSTTTWQNGPQLLASDAVSYTQFGDSVSLAGTTLVVGETGIGGGSGIATQQGRAYVFAWSGTSWSQQAELVPSEGFSGDAAGSAVWTDGTHVFIGAPGWKPSGATTASGAVFVFSGAGASWTEQAPLPIPTGAKNLGGSIAGSNGRIVVASNGNGTFGSTGTAYLFAYTDASPCTNGDQCATGHCVEGICCDTACNTACSSCLASRKGTGSDGACGPVAAGGADPACPATMCTAAGQGAGACNGAGACAPQSPTTCGLYVCNAAATACDVACKSDGDCVTSAWCSSGTCVAKHANGAACAAPDQCSSGFCADAVCCDSACTGTKCEACSAAAKGQGADGTCGLVAFGLDPHGDCPTAQCDPATTQLTTFSCDGKGACTSVATSCSPAKCNAADNACQASCATNLDCGASGYCVAGTCAAKQSSGATCTANAQCASGFCVDGVCCNDACSGECQACDEPGQAGSCVAVTGKPRGSRPACADDGKGCGGQCDGSNVSVCAYPSSKTVCGGGCSGAQISVCDGAGTCGLATACAGNLVCASATACKASCAAASDCATGFLCVAGACVGKSPRGSTCTKGDQCVSGFCPDGVCCDSACDGQCQACAEPGSVGTCVAVKGTPRAPRTDCAGKASSCYGQCDGTNIAACRYPNADTSCASGCADGKAQVCDGAGSCLAPKPCSGNFACAGATACLTSCSSDGDCAGGFTCSGGKCAPKKAATCSSDGSESIPTDDAGAPEACAPYVCGSDGTCKSTCATTVDCASGNDCDTSVSPGQCVPAAVQPASSANSGGCAIDARGSAGTWRVLAIFGSLAALGGVRRRRRAR